MYLAAIIAFMSVLIYVVISQREMHWQQSSCLVNFFEKATPSIAAWLASLLDCLQSAKDKMKTPIISICMHTRFKMQYPPAFVETTESTVNRWLFVGRDMSIRYTVFCIRMQFELFYIIFEYTRQRLNTQTFLWLSYFLGYHFDCSAMISSRF